MCLRDIKTIDESAKNAEGNSYKEVGNMRFRLEINKNREEEIVAVVHKPTELTDKIERLVREDAGDTKLTVYSEERDVILELDYQDLESVLVRNGKTMIVDKNGKEYASRLRLYELEEVLPACFIRINKSALANRKYIERFEAAFGGAVNVVFCSGHSDYVSRRCFAEIKRRIEKK